MNNRAQHGSSILRITRWPLLLLASLLHLAFVGNAWAVGDASTFFQIYVPPNNSPGRDVSLIVTNASPFATMVDIIDDDSDGDADDTVRGIQLERGQSYVRYIRDGAVNDDAGGKWDGDYFLVASDDPVVVQMATQSDWQWDFAPAENKTMRGQSFFIYSPSTSFSQRDVDLVAYEDNTEVYVLDITVTPMNVTGLTTVNLETPKEVLKTTLNAGEDLISRKNLGIDILDPGHSYWIRASKGVTCQYGSLVGNSRDGGGYIPSRNGFASGDYFVFMAPADYGGEREVRIVSFDDNNTVTLSGWNGTTRGWELVESFAVDRFGHADWIESGTSFSLYRLECTEGKKVAVFGASWLEAKGLSNTKDVASFAPSETGYGAGKEFLVYVPQPGQENNVKINGVAIGNASHLYLFGHVNGTEYEVVDADTGGTLFSRSGRLDRDGFVDVRMSDAEFAALNKPAQGLRPYLKVTSNHIITVLMTNFNDNWMTYVPSAVLPNPVLTSSANVDVATVGGDLCITFTADNKGAGALSGSIVEMVLDPATSYVSSTMSVAGLGEPIIETDEQTGGQILTWESFEIPANGVLQGTVCLHVNARRTDDSVVKNRDFLSFPIVARGQGFAVPVEQGGDFETFTAQTSVVLTVDNESQTNVSGLAATPAGNTVIVSWQTGREPDLRGFRVYRSTSGDGPFTLLNPALIPGEGDAVTGARYQYTDTPSNMGKVYYYRLEMVDDTEESSFFGPVSVLAEDRTPPPPPTLAVTSVEDNTVVLNVSGGNEDGDLKGYWIYRADTPTGNMVRINDILLTNSNVYTDRTAGNGRTYYYKARAVDTSDNMSEYSNVADATLPATIDHVYTLAYEDQVGPGKNDWDYNDWVVSLVSEEQFRDGGVESVSVEIESLARGARYHNAFRLRLRAAGSWNATVRILADRDATNPMETREEAGTGNVDLLLFADTVEALPPDEGEDFTNTLQRQSTARMGRVARVVITFDNPTANPSVGRQLPPFDPYLTSALGGIHQVREGFPASTEVVTFWPESPLLGFNLDYVLVVPEAHWYWPLENQKIWDAYPDVFARYMLSGGQTDTGWADEAMRNDQKTYNWYPFAVTKERSTGPLMVAKIMAEPLASFRTPFVASPKAITFDGNSLAADSILLAGANGEVNLIDGDGAMRPGWPIAANSFRATPAVGRLHAGDANPVLITAEERYDGAARMIAWELTPDPILRWQYEVGAAVKSPPVIADLDGDGDAEVLAVTTAGYLVVLDAEGRPVPNSPVFLGESQWNDKNILLSGSPVVADIDHDGTREIFAATPSGTRILGLRCTLDPLPGWPVETAAAIAGGLTAVRNPEDGKLCITAASTDGEVATWDTFGQHVDAWTISVGEPITTRPTFFTEAITGMDYLVVATSTGSVYMLDATGAIVGGWSKHLFEPIFASPVVGDLDGDAEPEVLVATQTGHVYTWNLDGSPNAEMTFDVAGAIQATPLLTDFDNDARIEVTIATATGDVIRREGSGQTPLPMELALNWPSVTGPRPENTIGDFLQTSPAQTPVGDVGDLLHVLLGFAAPDSSILYDLNLDSRVDSADLLLVPR